MGSVGLPSEVETGEDRLRVCNTLRILEDCWDPDWSESLQGEGLRAGRGTPPLQEQLRGTLYSEGWAVSVALTLMLAQNCLLYTSPSPRD